MSKIKKWLDGLSSGSILFFVALVSIIVAVYALNSHSDKWQEKTEAYQHQLTALCGAMDKAAKSKGIDLHIFVKPPIGERAPSICFGLQGDTYTVFYDGRVDIYKCGLPVQHIGKTWKDYPLFWSLGKK